MDPWDNLSLLDLFQDDLSHISIFSRLSTRACMSVPIVDYGKSNPMSIISLTCRDFLFLAVSIFRHWTYVGGLLVILSIFGEFGSVSIG
jgi:hypothetical protein